MLSDPSSVSHLEVRLERGEVDGPGPLQRGLGPAALEEAEEEEGHGKEGRGEEGLVQ